MRTFKIKLGIATGLLCVGSVVLASIADDFKDKWHSERSVIAAMDGAAGIASTES